MLCGWVCCITNSIESLSAIIKQKTKSRDAFPTQESALKTLYSAT